MKDVYPAISRSHPAGQFSRAIRGVVVHDENMDPFPLGKYLHGKPFDIVPLIVSRHHDNGFQNGQPFSG
jgi:hypothetical protein